MRWTQLLLVLITAATAACSHAGASTTSPASAVALRTNVAGDQPGRLAPAPAASIGDLERAFSNAADAIGPAVVSIISERPTENLPPFMRQFGPGDGPMRGIGSGVIVDKRGYVLTNNHVVAGADTLRVSLHDGREVEADVVGTDPKTDLAVIRIDVSGIQPAALADSDGLRVGQWVLAIGSPFGLRKSVTAGIVSAVGRGGMDITDNGDFIQTDAAINQGNSGGPLIDLHGRVVGINTAIASLTGGSNGVGFAIPVSLARVVTQQIIEHGSVERGWLGVVMGRLTPDLARSFRFSGNEGVLIDDVDASGPAAKAGLKPGDIVFEVDGKRVRDTESFRNSIALTRPGSKVRLTIWRGGGSQKLEVKLGSLKGGDEREKPRKAPAKPAVKREQGLGLGVGDLDADTRRRIGLADGKGVVVTEVGAGSLADEVGLRPGDVVLEVDGERVDSARKAEKQLAKGSLDAGVRLRVKRGEFARYIVLKRRK
jgi:serine protease Do